MFLLDPNNPENSNITAMTIVPGDICTVKVLNGFLNYRVSTDIKWCDLTENDEVQTWTFLRQSNVEREVMAGHQGPRWSALWFFWSEHQQVVEVDSFDFFECLVRKIN